MRISRATKGTGGKYRRHFSQWDLRITDVIQRERSLVARTSYEIWENSLYHEFGYFPRRCMVLIFFFRYIRGQSYLRSNAEILEEISSFLSRFLSSMSALVGLNWLMPNKTYTAIISTSCTVRYCKNILKWQKWKFWAPCGRRLGRRLSAAREPEYRRRRAGCFDWRGGVKLQPLHRWSETPWLWNHPLQLVLTTEEGLEWNSCGTDYGSACHISQKWRRKGTI